MKTVMGKRRTRRNQDQGVDQSQKNPKGGRGQGRGAGRATGRRGRGQGRTRRRARRREGQRVRSQRRRSSVTMIKRRLAMSRRRRRRILLTWRFQTPLNGKTILSFCINILMIMFWWTWPRLFGKSTNTTSILSIPLAIALFSIHWIECQV